MRSLNFVERRVRDGSELDGLGLDVAFFPSFEKTNVEGS
jgi:hypothetical protein